MTTRSPLRLLLNGLVLLAVVLALALHLVGGWYFSGRIGEEALEVTTAGPPPEEAEVVLVEGDRLTLRALTTPAPDLTGSATMGLDLGDSYATLGDIVSDRAGTVTRTFEMLAGPPPSVGTRGDLDPNAFPFDPEPAGLEVETVAYDSPLGPMEAWMVPGPGSTWVVHVHGKGSSPQEAIRLMRPLAEAGYPQLAITYRNDPGQPSDPSGYHRYGLTEWEDLAGAVAYARSAGAEEVVLAGYSTGAAIAAAYLYRHPEEVAAAVFDSPNLDMDAAVELGAQREELPFGLPVPSTLTETAQFLASLRYGVSWDAIDYLRRAGQLTVPVLVFHGTEDDLVPIDVSRRLAEARGELVTLVETEGAGHVRSWNVDPAGYERRVLDFLDATAS